MGRKIRLANKEKEWLKDGIKINWSTIPELKTITNQVEAEIYHENSNNQPWIF